MQSVEDLNAPAHTDHSPEPGHWHRRCSVRGRRHRRSSGVRRRRAHTRRLASFLRPSGRRRSRRLARRWRSAPGCSCHTFCRKLGTQSGTLRRRRRWSISGSRGPAAAGRMDSLMRRQKVNGNCQHGKARGEHGKTALATAPCTECTWRPPPGASGRSTRRIPCNCSGWCTPGILAARWSTAMSKDEGVSAACKLRTIHQPACCGASHSPLGSRHFQRETDRSGTLHTRGR